MKIRDIVLSFTLLLFALFPAIPSHAQPDLSSVCSLSFEASGTDIQFLIGYSKLVGEGTVTCIDANGALEQLAVKVTIGTPILFPRVSFAPLLTVRGGAQGISILKGGPKVVLGKYLTVDLRAAIGSGFAKFLALESDENGLSFSLGLDEVDGFGIAVGGTVVTIE